MRQLKRKSKIRFLSLLTTGLLYLSLCLSANVYAATPNPSVPVDAKDEVYKSEPVIVSEDTSLRGEYEKHFQKSDGSYAVATYTMPVHYQDEATGGWNEIDNRLVESVDKNGGVVYRNRDGLFDVSFARTPGANPADLVTMESEGHTISWKLISSDNTIHKVKSADYTNNGREDLVLTGTAAEILDISAADSAPVSKMAAEKTVSALVYNDLADQDTDVRFTVTPLKVKEDFLLDKAPNEAISYTTLLYLSDGLTPTVLEHGDISVTDEDGREIFCIASPYMTDAADEMSADIAVDFKQDGDGWRLTVTPDLAWLQDDARVYPVTVDPTVYATNNAANTWDTYIYEDSTSSGGRSRQDLDRMYVGNRSSAQKKCRGLIKFLTMPTISGTITGATLTLTTPSGTSTWQGMTLYRITEDWVSESVTWAEQPYASFIQSQTANGGKYVFDVTTAIRDMYRYSTAASSNYGFEVCYTNESINDYNSICSSEHGTDTDVNSTKPYLVIHYDYYAPNPTPGIVSGKNYYIRSVNSGKYMDVTNFGGNTTSVTQHGLNGGTNQQWRVVYHAEGWYSLAPAHNLNLRLDVPGGNRVNGQDLWVYNSNNTSTQRWRIIPNGDGSYRLMPMCAQHENMVIDVDSASQSNGAALQLWTWDGVSPQMKWYFDDVESTKYYGAVTARGEVAVGSNLAFVFRVNSRAEYVIETAQPNSSYGTLRDTYLGLYYINGEEIAFDDDSGVGYYSKIVITLNPGDYMVKLSEYGGKTENVAAYIAIFKSNELVGYTINGNISDYANMCYDFIKIGDSTQTYNCLAYALGITNRWMNPFGSLAKTTQEMGKKGYTKVDSPTTNCIVAYGTVDNVVHFSRIENGIVNAKCGGYELLQHSHYNAYYSQSSYGSPVAYYVKN